MTAGKLSSSLIIGNKQYNGDKEVTITKSDIGLGNVDNTADKDKKVLQATNDGNGDNIADTYFKSEQPIVWSDANYTYKQMSYISKLDNQFAALNKWAYIDFECSGNYDGNYINLFRAKYETNLAVYNNATAKITIKFDKTGTQQYFDYPYGFLYFFWYYGAVPLEFQVRVYNTYEPQTAGWHTLDVEKLTSSLWRTRQTYYGLTQIEITFKGNEKSSFRDGATTLSAIEFHGTRPSMTQPHPYLSKYVPETLYYDLTAPNFIGNLNGTSESSKSLIWTEYK